MSNEDIEDLSNQRVFDSSPTEPIVMQAPELTPQDKGEPSPVPYSIFIKSPAVDTQEEGIEKINISLALKDLDADTLRWYIPQDVRTLVEFARNCFEGGYYRFELIVGDWSIRVYKHPNNP